MSDACNSVNHESVSGFLCLVGGSLKRSAVFSPRSGVMASAGNESRKIPCIVPGE